METVKWFNMIIYKERVSYISKVTFKIWMNISSNKEKNLKGREHFIIRFLFKTQFKSYEDFLDMLSNSGNRTDFPKLKLLNRIKVFCIFSG